MGWPPGPVGPQGEPGVDGQDGQNGENGKDVTAVAVWMSCFVTLDLVPGDVDTQETALGYTLIFYGNGDLEVECETGLGAAQDDFSHTYYPNVTKGASSGYCSGGSDYPPFDEVAGRWVFTIDQGEPRATYSDISSHPMDGDFYSFSNNDCHVYIANSDGTWGAAELEDLF